MYENNKTSPDSAHAGQRKHGKSIEAAARASWLNQRGIPWQGFDLDGDNRTLSRLFPGQVKLTPLSGQAEDLDELILILRKTTAQLSP